SASSEPSPAAVLMSARENTWRVSTSSVRLPADVLLPMQSTVRLPGARFGPVAKLIWMPKYGSSHDASKPAIGKPMWRCPFAPRGARQLLRRGARGYLVASSAGAAERGDFVDEGFTSSTPAAAAISASAA